MQNKKLMITLGALALVRPLFKITGLIQLFQNEARGSIVLTLFISVAWVAIIVKENPSKPLQVSIGAGICYAILATVLSGILSPILEGTLQGPLSNPLALISILVTNAFWGLVIGCIAKGILSIQK